MTQEEWDRASPEKRVLHQFLAAMADTSMSGKRVREALLELVADLPPELRAVNPVPDTEPQRRGRTAPTAQFHDARVQTVYAILCADEKPPEGEHWEGFVARRIVDALAAPQEPQWRKQMRAEMVEELALCRGERLTTPAPAQAEPRRDATDVLKEWKHMGTSGEQQP